MVETVKGDPLPQPESSKAPADDRRFDIIEQRMTELCVVANDGGPAYYEAREALMRDVKRLVLERGAVAEPYSAEVLPEVIEILRGLSDGSMPPSMYVLNAENVGRLAATLAELEQLRQDKERLDWLSSKRILHIHGDAPGDFEFSPRGSSLRVAIDFEMEGGR